MEKIREKIIERIEAGQRPSEIKKAFNVSYAAIRTAKRIFEATGNFSKLENGGRPRTIRTQTLINRVQESVEDNPKQNVRRMARDFNVSRSTMGRLVNKDLGLKSRAISKVQSLTALQRQKRFERSKKLLNWLKSNKEKKAIVFSDEKNFTVEQFTNRRNSRYLAVDPDDVDPSVRYSPHGKFPAKAMMFGLVGTDGFTIPPVWFKKSMDGNDYRHMLEETVIPALNAHYGRNKWVLQQDGAPSHTSIATQAFLTEKLGSRGFWPKQFWPPSSPNLNPLDYFVWTHVEEKACATAHPNITAMKQAVNEIWARMDADILKSAISKFRSRLQKCIAAEGGIFEK